MLKKIISGGQTGADIAGVIVGKLYGLQTGGTMPKGFKTLIGSRPEYANMYNMEEHTNPAYPPRTYKNVKDSDGTLRLAFDFDSRGEICTLKAIHTYIKPHLDVDMNNPLEPIIVAAWVETNKIETLNVAGNSDKTHSAMTLIAAKYLCRVFDALGLERKYGI